MSPEPTVNPPKLQLLMLNGDTVRLYKKYFLYILYIGLILSVISLFIPQYNPDITDVAALLRNLQFTLVVASAISIVSTITTATLLWFIDRNERGEQISILTALNQVKSRILPFFVSGLLIGTISTLGLVLLVVPGAILGLMFSQATFFVLFKNQGIFKSLSLSSKLTKGNRKAILYAYSQLTIIAILALVVGEVLSQFLNLENARAFNNVVAAAVNIFLGQAGIVVSYVIWRALNTTHPLA